MALPLVLQNMLDVPQFEMEIWLRGHTRSLPWYDGKLELGHVQHVL